MKLNCDLGESFGAWNMGMDVDVMPYIDQANIACGFHAGDPMVIQNTLALAQQNQVSVGAHPSYPDLVGFGRRSMNCSTQEIIALIQYQVSALAGMAQIQGLTLEYVKPHGALYNDMMKDINVFEAIVSAISQSPNKLTLMIQATPDNELYLNKAEMLDVTLYFEAFADRRYDDNGLLVSRSIAGAVLSKQDMLTQVKQLKEHGSVTSISGKELKLQVDSLCVHGDNIEGVQAIAEIRALLN